MIRSTKVGVLTICGVLALSGTVMATLVFGPPQNDPNLSSNCVNGSVLGEAVLASNNPKAVVAAMSPDSPSGSSIWAYGWTTAPMPNGITGKAVLTFVTTPGHSTVSGSAPTNLTWWRSGCDNGN
jgi:hypothetical protein